jgi:hypothetical protein
MFVLFYDEYQLRLSEVVQSHDWVLRPFEVLEEGQQIIDREMKGESSQQVVFFSSQGMLD